MSEGKLTLADVEEVVNQFASRYAHETHGLPKTAIRVILWPSAPFITMVQRGPTAIITMGRLPGDPVFNKAMRGAIDHVASHKLYECMTVDRVADIVRREDELRRVQRERYGFMRELIPDALADEEITFARITRVEVTHQATGLREVMEVEQGKGNIFTMQEVIKARLARRVNDARRAALIDPTTLDPSDPNWIAKTA